MNEEQKDLSLPEEQNDPPSIDIAEPSADGAAEKEGTPKREPTFGKRNKSQWRGWWLKTMLMVALIAVSVAIMFGISTYLSPEGTKSLPEMIRGIDPLFFALLIGVILVYIIVESSKYAYLLKISANKFYVRTSVKTMFLGKYYDGITPLSTGGQPFQIYYLHKKHDLPHGIATAVPLVRYIVSALIITIISVVFLILTPTFVVNNAITTTIIIMSWISIALNCAVPVAIVLFSVSPNRTKRALTGIIKLLIKLHIVKHPYQTTKKWLRELNEYQQALKMFARKLKYAAPLVLLCAAECIINYSIPFFALIAIANVTPSVMLYLQILCLSTITRYTALLIPTPGNTGAVETAGSLVFITVSGAESVIGWVVLVWRFLTYYVYILSGIGINIFEIIRSAVRNKRADKKDL